MNWRADLASFWLDVKDAMALTLDDPGMALLIFVTVAFSLATLASL